MSAGVGRLSRSQGIDLAAEMVGRYNNKIRYAITASCQAARI